jgi:hypothetical protein
MAAPTKPGLRSVVSRSPIGARNDGRSPPQLGPLFTAAMACVYGRTEPISNPRGLTIETAYPIRPFPRSPTISAKSKVRKISVAGPFSFEAMRQKTTENFSCPACSFVQVIILWHPQPVHERAS